MLMYLEPSLPLLLPHWQLFGQRLHTPCAAFGIPFLVLPDVQRNAAPSSLDYGGTRQSSTLGIMAAYSGLTLLGGSSLTL